MNNNGFILLEQTYPRNAVMSGQEDWTGMTDPVKRRRLQSRLNMRAYRQREAARRLNPLLSTASPKALKDDSVHQHMSGDCCSLTWVPNVDLDPKMPQMFNAILGSTRFAVHERLSAVALSCPDAYGASQLCFQLNQWARHRIPTADQLLVLVKLNVFRALLRNSMMLGFPTQQHMNDDAISPFYGHFGLQVTCQTGPRSLRPTPIQQQVLHHPWIDLLPIPRMRDNILRAGDAFDEMALCGDLIGMFSESSAEKSMVVWGDSCDPAEWEVTEAFIKRWGWTIIGCCELFESTNHWRRSRNERPLDFGALSCDQSHYI